MKVLTCIARAPNKDNKIFYDVLLQRGDEQIVAFAFDPVNPGTEIEDSRVTPDSRGTGWLLKSAPRQGGAKREYIPKDEDITTARTGWMCATDLVVAGKIDVKDQAAKADEIANGIKNTYNRLKPPAGPSSTSGPAPSRAVSPPGIEPPTDDSQTSRRPPPAAAATPSAPAGQPPMPHGADLSKVPPPPIIPATEAPEAPLFDETDDKKPISATEYKSQFDALVLRLGVSKGLLLTHLNGMGLVNEKGLVTISNREPILAELTKMCETENK